MTNKHEQNLKKKWEKKIEKNTYLEKVKFSKSFILFRLILIIFKKTHKKRKIEKHEKKL